MKKQIFFSIVIPARNEENCILNAISSILAQSYDHYEIIVVDNASTDSTQQKVLEAYDSDTRVKLVSCPQKGILYARQTGLEATTEVSSDSVQYIFQMDAARWLPKGYLQRAARILQKNPTVAGLCGAYRHRDAPWWFKVAEYIQYPSMYIGNLYVQWRNYGALAIGGNFIIKKSILVAVGYEKTSAFYFEDLKTARSVVQANQGKIKFCFSLDINSLARTYRDQTTGRITISSVLRKQRLYNLGTTAVLHGKEFPPEPTLK